MYKILSLWLQMSNYGMGFLLRWVTGDAIFALLLGFGFLVG